MKVPHSASVIRNGVLYGPPCCPVGLRPDLTGPSQFRWTLPDSPLDFRRIPMDSAMFRYKSGQSPVKVRSSGLMAKNGWTGWTCQSIGLPPDFHRTYKQKRQTRQYFLLSQYFQGPLGIIRVLLFLETT
jgi:hypothetical protein